MTPHQSKVLDVLNASDEWMTIKQISNATGIDPHVLHKTMNSEAFKDIEIGYQHMKVVNRLMDVKTYRVKRKRSSTTEALKLAKKHQGVWGQLFFGENNEL